MKSCVSILIAVLLAGCSAKSPPNSENGQAQSPATAARTAPSSIPGTAVRLWPPDGFVPADRFSGFMNESNGSSIIVTEIPGPYSEVTAGFRDTKKLHAQGMTLLDHSSVKVDGRGAMLLDAEQVAYGTLFRKWILAIDRPGGTTLIIASFPKAEAEQGETLKAAILAATFGERSDPAEALAFVVTPVVPFEVAEIIGQSMILSPNGLFPVKDENIPMLVLGLSVSEGVIPADRKAFAERRVTQFASVKSITVDHTDPITVGPLTGYATTAKGIGERAATPLTIYQVLLFDPSGYCVIQGTTPTAQKDTYLPIFEQVARSFRMKETHNPQADGTR